MERWSGSADSQPPWTPCRPVLLSIYRARLQRGRGPPHGIGADSILVQEAAWFYGSFGRFTGGAYGATAAVVKSSPPLCGAFAEPSDRLEP